MPYNNTPIAPSSEITGTVSLPLARVKKIIAADDDIANCSNNAAFMITIAAEMFLQHLVEQSYNIVKSERKPRRNIQYRDVANAVSRVENLEFLTDVVPKTTTLKQHRENGQQKQKHSGAAARAIAEDEARAQQQRTEWDAAAKARALVSQNPTQEPARTGAGEGVRPQSATTANGPDSPQAVIPVGEAQASNGAARHEDGDAMEVDEDVKEVTKEDVRSPEVRKMLND